MPIYRRPPGTPEVRAEITSHLVEGKPIIQVTSIAYEGETAPSDYLVRGQLLQFNSDGFTNEILLAIVLDRLECLNKEVSCWENRHAIHDIRNALTYLKARTVERAQRGVEGTPAP